MPPLDDGAAVRRFLAPYASLPWRWDDEGEVIAWINGQTIVFRAELDDVLTRLAPYGLPPLSALVPLLAACRDGWQSESSRLSTTAGLITTIERGDFPEWFGNLFPLLDVVRAMPAELRATPLAKADLAELVFEECRTRTSPELADSVRWALSGYLGPEMLAPQPDLSSGFQGVLRELRCLYEGLARLDVEKLRLRRRTGFDQLVRPADVKLPPAELARRLIARLHNDEELGGMARIAHSVLAAIHLPHALTDHDDLPVGGISDISHRGSPDRLLLSELAHDDLTLAVRIALGEAIYLRREAPRRDSPKHRAVLIDAGIRLWGIPRVFAAAVALSLVAAASRNIRIDAYRASGRSVEPVNLTQREGLIAHLEALEPDPHPGDCFQAFLSAASKWGELRDAVIVTGEDVAADQGFQQAMATLEVPSLLLATVSREGRFRLISCGTRSRKVLREARLDLEKLLTPASRPAVPLLDTSLITPAVLVQKPFPLLLSHAGVDARRAWVVPGHGVLSICRNRCLWRWQHSGRGARLLADKLPPGKVHWVGAGANGWESLAVVGQLQSSRLWLLRVDLAAGTCRSIPLELGGHSPRGVCGHGGMLFVVYDDCADVFGPLDGHRQELLKLPRGARWRHGRFLRRQDSWYAISHDGLAAHAEPLGVPRRWQAPPRFLALVDRAGCDGPIALTTDGHLYDLAHNRVIRVSHGLSGILLVEAIARDGSCIVISQGDDQAKMAVIEVPSGVSYRVSGNPATIAEASVFGATVRTRNLSHHFRAVCVQSDHLVLVRPKDTCARIEPDQHQHDVVLRSEAVAADQRRLAVEFRQIDSPTDAGYTLRLAAWDDGSRAVLDSRGLLHLKSSDPAIPEVTLVLCEGALAGWCADGRWFGPAYFIAEHAPTRGAAIYKQVLKPFVARLR